ncbi:MAG: metallophosphoesterase [Muribaculaceae bacterium]|nr:metallophosphoesterase [Muribaculaceae bacterium]MBQ7205698.1 metallophosphoesterase [Muribaculaceae bacterium]
MKINWVGLIIMALVCIAMDVFISRRLKRRGYRWTMWFNVLLAVLSAGLVVAIGILPMSSASMANSTFVTCQYMLYTFFAILAPKSLGMVVYGIGRWLKCRWAAACAFVVAALVFGVMWWGAIVTPASLEVREVEMAFDNLPDAFDGYRIVQWSDAHLGTYNGHTAIVENQVNTINSLHPDMICFTGDLVSRETNEAEPYRELLSRLHAPDGVFSVLGNHDYDDYVKWDDENAKLADRKALCDLQTSIGWRLLNDDYALIKRGSDQMVLIGTENFGDRVGEKRGSLVKAYSGLKDSNFKILLQHNPYAWRANTLTNSNIDLMLAGHTHAWQMMLKLGNWRWSPACLRYPEWGGEYSEGKQRLYVNIGTGMVGPPMRIGATPEITVITLKKKVSSP